MPSGNVSANSEEARGMCQGEQQKRLIVEVEVGVEDLVVGGKRVLQEAVGRDMEEKELHAVADAIARRQAVPAQTLGLAEGVYLTRGHSDAP